MFELPFELPKDPPPYRGPEPRKGADRRQASDRREEFRFELGKEDRRSGKDRRKRGSWDGTLIGWRRLASASCGYSQRTFLR